MKAFLKTLLMGAAILVFVSLESCLPIVPDTTKYARVIRELKDFIKTEMEKYEIAGISIAIVEDQRVVWAEGFGYADGAKMIRVRKNTVYRVGPITQLLTGIAVMQLHEKGKLDIDSPIVNYLPEFSPEKPLARGNPTTLRQLLAHRSGFPRESPVGNYYDQSSPTLRHTVESVYGIGLVYSPETKIKFSDIGFAVAGYIVERVSGKEYQDYVERRLLRPMKMDSSGFECKGRIRDALAEPNVWAANGESARGEQVEVPVFELGAAPAGNLYSTAADLARFHSCVFAGGKAGPTRVIKEKTLKQMLQLQFETEGQKLGLGLGFILGEMQGYSTYGQGGTIHGFSSTLIGIPELKLGVVVLANDGIAQVITESIAQLALELMIEAKTGKQPAKRPKRVELDLDIIERLAGTYESSNHWARLEVDDGEVKCNLSGQDADLYPVSENEFVIRGRSVRASRLNIERRPDGSVSGFTYQDMEFSKIDPQKPPAYPKQWDRLAGIYGPDFAPLIVSVKYGHLYAFVGNYFDYRLERVSDTVLKFAGGLYDGEILQFFPDPTGDIERVLMANVELWPLGKRP